jgi:hypothetical protein
LFSFTKLENTRAEQFLPGGMRGGTSGSGEDVGKGCRRVNIVHMYVNGKMRPVETIPRMGEWWRG